MNSRLPPLKNIEAFEIAAKHLNFTQAGLDLSITSAAISQRVASLEAALDHKLFHRRGPTLELTEYGQLCRPILNDAMTQMLDAIGSLKDLSENRVLTIKTSPSFAQKWLIPRLGRFNQRHPDIDLQIWSTTDKVHLDEGELYLAIYYGIDPANAIAPSLAVDPLFNEQVFPVCSPGYASQQPKIESMEDLRNLRLLHDDTMSSMQIFPNWRRWFDEFGMKQVDATQGPRFIVSSVALQSAIEGQGVTLARGALVKDDLDAGRLVSPFAETYPLSFEYFFVYPKLLAGRASFRAFREWLHEEALLFSK